MKKWGLILLILTVATILRLWMLNGGDVTDDEKHYIIDAQRLLNKDPYIAIRYHTSRHPEPSIGHPFLYQIEQAFIFKFLGLSVYTSRLPNAISGIAIVALMFLFTKELGGRVAVLAAFFAAIIPMAVRYSRNAQLDTVFALWITIAALSAWRYINGGRKYWLLVAGLCAGFAISTKLNGIYALLMIVLLLTFATREKPSRKFITRLTPEILLVLIPAGIISFLLNDPRAYLDGILHPSFEAYNFFSKEFFTQRLPFLFSIRSAFSFTKVNFLLLSPGFLLATITAFYFLIFKTKKIVSRFLILWLLPFLNLFIIHGFGMDGAYGWIPFIPPTALAVSYWINGLQKKFADLIVFGIVILLLPFLFLYGLSFASLPFDNFPVNHNRTIKQNFYQETVAKVNEITPKNGSVFLLPQVYYPLYALRPDISWSYSNLDLEDFDTYVVADQSLLSSVSNKVQLIQVKGGFQDGEVLTRFIFAKKLLR